MADETVDELFQQALSGDEEDENAWQAVRKLQFHGTREVLDSAIALTHSENPAHRGRAADILAQLGVQPGIASAAFIEERIEAVLDLLRREKNRGALASAIAAVGHLKYQNEEIFQEVLTFQDSDDDHVRYQVACALGGIDDPRAIKALIRLTTDIDSDIRDWATFGLGTQCKSDSNEIRAALLARTTDSDHDTRQEAIRGLAERKDVRVLSALIAALEDNRDDLYMLDIESADTMLDKDDEEEWTPDEYISALRARFPAS